MSGSVAALAPAERTTPVEASGASGYVSVVSARALAAIGWATIIVAALVHGPAPILVARTSRKPTPLVDPEQTTQGSPLQAMPARDMSRNCTAKPVFEAATRAGFCRTWGSCKREHRRSDQSNLPHQKSPVARQRDARGRGSDF